MLSLFLQCGRQKCVASGRPRCGAGREKYVVSGRCGCTTASRQKYIAYAVADEVIFPDQGQIVQNCQMMGCFGL